MREHGGALVTLSQASNAPAPVHMPAEVDGVRSFT
jgi:hypothetical protein